MPQLKAGLVSSRYLERRKLQHAGVTLVLPILALPIAIYQVVAGSVQAFELCILAVFYFIGMMGIELGFHRLFSHRAFVPKPTLKALLAIFGCTGGQGPPIYWVSNHRTHHRFSDRVGDLHSPHLRKRHPLRELFHAQMGWVFDHVPPDYKVLCFDQLSDPTLMKINKQYPYWLLASVLAPAVLTGAYYGSWVGFFQGLLWGGLVRLFLVQHMTLVINSLCHYVGSRDFETLDQSRNVWWLALPTGGGAWHNNHHAFPQSAKCGLLPGQFDLNWHIVQLLAKVGWVSAIQLPTQDQMINRRISYGHHAKCQSQLSEL